MAEGRNGSAMPVTRTTLPDGSISTTITGNSIMQLRAIWALRICNYAYAHGRTPVIHALMGGTHPVRLQNAWRVVFQEVGLPYVSSKKARLHALKQLAQKLGMTLDYGVA